MRCKQIVKKRTCVLFLNPTTYCSHSFLLRELEIKKLQRRIKQKFVGLCFCKQWFIMRITGDSWKFRCLLCSNCVAWVTIFKSLNRVTLCNNDAMTRVSLFAQRVDSSHNVMTRYMSRFTVGKFPKPVETRIWSVPISHSKKIAKSSELVWAKLPNRWHEVTQLNQVPNTNGSWIDKYDSATSLISCIVRRWTMIKRMNYRHTGGSLAVKRHLSALVCIVDIV